MVNETPQQNAYSALTNRPAPKVVDDSDTSSYVAGVRLTDALTERRRQFDGWKNDPDAQLVVRALETGERAKFDGADFTDVNFSGAKLTGVNFKGADLRNADLSGTDLRNADLSGADLRGVNLEEANLEGANLEGAKLDGAYLKNAVIAGAKLSKQALNELEKMQQLQREAEEGILDLRKVNLRYLDLRRLDLRGVDLTGVDLSGVNLVGVNLSGVKIDPMYLDGSYAFKQGTNRKVEIQKGNTAGLDLTTANQIKASLTDLEILRQKRLAGKQAEEQAVAEMARMAEEQRLKEEMPPAAEQKHVDEQPLSAYEPLTPAAEPEPVRFAREYEQPTPREDETELSKELALLRERRLNQVSPEELKSRLQDVVFEKRPELKSGAKSLVTRRPRRKEELPPSKYDFPILYPVDEDEKTPQKSVVREVSSAVVEQVKTVVHKLMPVRRVRVKRQRQRQRS